MKSCLVGLVMMGLGTCLGCSNGPSTDYSKLGLVSISGKITLDGSPLPGAAVFFINEADRTHCYGVTDNAGHYTLMLNSEKAGVIPGEKRVEIATARNPLGNSGASAEGDGGAEEEDPDAAPKQSKNEKVPACYNTKSKLKISVTGADNSLDFDLKTDCSTMSAT